MKQVKNEKGVTLVEILAAVVILTIIIGSLMNFFPQMAAINKVNEEKSQAITMVKQKLIEWKSSPGVSSYILNSDTSQLPAPLDHFDNDFNYFVVTSGINTFNISIAKNTPVGFPDNALHPSKLRFIKVQLLQKNKVVSETYGYLTLN